MRFIDASLIVRWIIIIAYIFILVISIIGLVTAVRLCKERRFAILSSLIFVLAFISLFLTMRGSYRHSVNLSVFEPSLTIIKLPIWVFFIVLVILFMCEIFGLIHTVLWSKRHLSPISIKESADKIPSGICFYEESGLVCFVNNKMNELCILTIGKALLNGVDFWEKISLGKTKSSCEILKTGEEPIIEYEDGNIVSFKKYLHYINNKNVYEIVAVDITEKYYLTKMLEKKVDELKSINKRLLEYGNNVVELTREKELLAAKIRIHDDMGKLLLATKHKLDEDLTNDEKEELIGFWKVEIAALKSTRMKNKRSNLQVIEDAAKLVGVNIEFCGEQPRSNSTNEKILITAMHECLTNTVSHANGKNMKVVTVKENGRYKIRITNDGEQPKCEIIEGGGLSTLRTFVEHENGIMVINSLPQFELIVELQEVETI